ncbi:MAG: hypothetical protein QOH06_951 [Acidobacteriota bacterium]|jgi:hypothetical protein|nr:hypothetical protein [Acidobacteriota bacterium]
MSGDERLQEILNAWRDALGTPLRLREQRSAALQGTIHFVSAEGLGFCGSIEVYYTDKGEFRVDVLLAGSSYMTLVFGLGRNRGWFLDPDNQVSALPPDVISRLVGLLYLLTYSWSIPDRVPGKVRLLREDREAGQNVLETEARHGTPFTVRLGIGSSLPEQLSYQAEPDRESKPAPSPHQRLHIAGSRWDVPSFSGLEPGGREAQTVSVAVQSWLEAGGIHFPARLVMTGSGSPGQTVVVFQEAAVNPPLSPGLFNKPVPPDPDIHFQGRGTRTRVRFDLVTNNVFVDTSVNGSAALAFALDTGTSVVVIDQTVATKLGIKCVCRFRNLLGGGTQTSDTCVTPKMDLRVGQLQAGRRGLGIDLRGLSQNKIGQAIDGILGGTLLSSLLVDINYPEGWVELCDPRDTDDFASVKIKLTAAGGVPYVRVKLALPHGETEALLMVDTGTQEAIILNQPFVAKHHLLKTVSPQISTMDFGLAGSIPYVLGRLARARLGPLEIVNPVVNLAATGAGSLGSSDFDGFLGAEVLMRTRVAFDYKRREMRVAPGKAFHAPYEYNMSGMVLVTRSPGFTTFVVAYVIADSPAQQAGILIGDVITSIDGRPATGFTLSGIKKMFLVPARRYVLGVARGGTVRSVEIITRPLI